MALAAKKHGDTKKRDGLLDRLRLVSIIIMTISEHLAYSTVRIECIGCDGITSTGTGFFFRFNENGKRESIPVVITNKHVIDGARKGTLVFTIAEAGSPVDTRHLTLHSEMVFEDFWKKHPDSAVDLCAMSITPFITAAKMQETDLYLTFLDCSNIPDKDNYDKLTALEEIVMVGYPDGFWDETNNKPIFRKGITATHPYADYNGTKEFLVDAACFPGSSGSPVIHLIENNVYAGRKIAVGMPKIILLGILYATLQSTSTGDIYIEKIPTKQKPIVLTGIPNNLGLVIKSERIRELELLFLNE